MHAPVHHFDIYATAAAAAGAPMPTDRTMDGVDPLPFARGAKVVGDPIHPPQGADAASIEGHRAAIEAALIAVARRADELVGRAPVEPGEPLR